MSTLKLFTIFLVLLVVNLRCSNQEGSNSAGKIIVEAKIALGFYWQLNEIFTRKEQFGLKFSPLKITASGRTDQTIQQKSKDGIVKWVLHSDEPLEITPPFGTAIILNPGDSLHILYYDETPIYSGSNELTTNLLNELMLAEEEINKPGKITEFITIDLPTYQKWSEYVNRRLETQLPIIESYKDKISIDKYEYYKATTIDEAERHRLVAFSALVNGVQQKKYLLNRSDLVNIWDTTQKKEWRQWLQSISNYYGSISDFIKFNKFEVWRHFGFNLDNDSLMSKDNRTYLYYTFAQKNYQGLLKERLMSTIVDEQVVKGKGLGKEMAQSILNDYYSQPGFPEYKKRIMILEKEVR